MYERGDMVEVEWYDAADEAAGWQDIDEALSASPKHPVKTIGYYLGAKEEHLYLTPTIKGDEFAVLSIIPEGCIIKINSLQRTMKYEVDLVTTCVMPDGAI